MKVDTDNYLSRLTKQFKESKTTGSVYIAIKRNCDNLIDNDRMHCTKKHRRIRKQLINEYSEKNPDQKYGLIIKSKFRSQSTSTNIEQIQNQLQSLLNVFRLNVEFKKGVSQKTKKITKITQKDENSKRTQKRIIKSQKNKERKVNKKLKKKEIKKQKAIELNKQIQNKNE